MPPTEALTGIQGALCQNPLPLRLRAPGYRPQSRPAAGLLPVQDRERGLQLILAAWLVTRAGRVLERVGQVGQKPE